MLLLRYLQSHYLAMQAISDDFRYRQDDKPGSQFKTTNMKKRQLLFFAVLTLASPKMFSQGCSDAGFCSIGTLAPVSAADSSFHHSAKISLAFGIGERGTQHIHIIPEIELGFLRKNVLQIKIPYVIVNGDLGSTGGVGDLSVSLSRQMFSGNNSALSITAGAKLPTGKTDLAINSIPLPMPYQTGLGTTDLVLGISYRYRKWNAGLGYQKVMSNNNENKFLHSDDYVVERNGYFESNLLKRSDDALFRVERNFDLNKVQISAGVLTLYRIQKDKITDAFGKEISLDGSDGLTLNITGNFQYLISGHSGIGVLIGAPLIVRKVRADGLTRGLVLSASYQYRFGK